METKKNASHDLTRKSGYFFSIGLAVSLSVVITAFEWRSPRGPVIEISDRKIDDFPETLVIPPTQLTPPVPQVIKNPIFKEVPENEVLPDLPPVVIDQLDTTASTLPVTPPEPEPDPDIEYRVVEVGAKPRGGMDAFYKYIGEKLKYPPQASRMGIEGKVFVEFVVGKDGTLANVKVIKGIGAGCDEEAVRIVRSAPPWEPARQRGKPVKQIFTIQINFRIT